jgi:hypothetical protein
MKKIAIEGSQDPNERKEMIKILESLGGYNTHHYLGNCSGAYYYIDFDNVIDWRRTLSTQEYELLTLKQYKEKYMNSETKELKIEIPKGYEIDKENSTFEKIVFKKVEEKLTYGKIVNELFTGKKYYYTNDYGTIKESADPEKVNDFCDTDPNNAPTERQLKILLAINKLMNVAHYLNDGWKPNWKDETQRKYYIYYDINDKAFVIDHNTHFNYGVVYFKSIEIAEQAIEILGDETIKLALGI